MPFAYSPEFRSMVVEQMRDGRSVAAHERVTESGDARLRGLLAAGDPYGEVRDAWHAKETASRL